MKKSRWFALWGGMFIVCAGLGFIPEPSGAMGALCTLCSILFFLPPAVLLWQGKNQRDEDTRMLIRNLSGASLGLTLVLLIANLLCATGSEALGQVLHTVLLIVSAPMFASGNWAVSLFLWACLLMASLGKGKKERTP